MSTTDYGHGVRRFACGHEAVVCGCPAHRADAPVDHDGLCSPCRLKLFQPLTPRRPSIVTEPFLPATD